MIDGEVSCQCLMATDGTVKMSGFIQDGTIDFHSYVCSLGILSPHANRERHHMSTVNGNQDICFLHMSVVKRSKDNTISTIPVDNVLFNTNVSDSWGNFLKYYGQLIIIVLIMAYTE